MKRREVLARLRPQINKLRSFGVKSLSLFGSVARGEARKDSDVDFVVDFEGPSTFDRYMDLKNFLENQLKHRVDLVTRKALRPQIRSAIRNDLIHVA